VEQIFGSHRRWAELPNFSIPIRLRLGLRQGDRG
jgi:hypothetical protein